ncbi:hypothetical protein KKB64_01740 [Patescibacteria group bacterium]|nr:hypothetical protein [Patescibacteria group bacterium]MBU1472493.1 hypothetical protein [Patescibacteria group bacterium]MBU2459550.1 hypothetical protein [Patescibacteria group bacterium]MBU2543861.1 hypothetical protein [Patescibacteria group bacterium]
MWIAHINIGHKKLLLLSSLFTITLVSALRLNPIFVPPVIAASAVSLGCIVYLAYTNGVFARRFIFSVGNQTYEIREYFSFSKPKDSYRAIIHLDSGGVVSSIYLTKRRAWKYLDIIRDTFEKLGRQTAQNALVLGGGGGALGYLLVRDGFARRVDVVEKSKKMIHIAKHRFLPHPIPKNVHFILQDAFDYLQNCICAHDIIIIDLFNGSAPSKLVASSDFLGLVKRSVAIKGAVIINFGYHGTYDLHDIISLYKSALRPFRVYLWNGSVIGIATKRTLSGIIGMRII